MSALAVTLPGAPAAGADTVDCMRVKCVALTFDDGPGPHTDRLLRILSAHGARATFFLIGDKVAGDPAAAARISGAGMEIGNHSWSHPDLTAIPAGDIAAQLSMAGDAIEAATGRRPTLMRAPFGKADDAVLAEAARQGLAGIDWDVVPFDWLNGADIAATRAALMEQIRPNSVVLLHDTFGSTVDVVEQVLPVLQADGYHPVTVSEMLRPNPPG